MHACLSASHSYWSRIYLFSVISFATAVTYLRWSSECQKPLTSRRQKQAVPYLLSHSNYLERAPCRAPAHKCLEMGSVEAKAHDGQRSASDGCGGQAGAFECLARPFYNLEGQVQPQAVKLSPPAVLFQACHGCPLTSTAQAINVRYLPTPSLLRTMVPVSD
jgi:hypothetical protein